MTEEEVRSIVRDEIARGLDDGGEIGSYVRTVVVNALRQIGMEELTQIRLGKKQSN